MHDKAIVAAVVAISLCAGSARAEELMLILCGLHDDAGIQGSSSSAKLLEFRIESMDGALVASKYVSMQSRGFSSTPPLSVTESLIWDAAFIASAPSAQYFDLGFTYNSALDTGGSRWDFHYNTGRGLTRGLIGYYIPEPAAMALLACTGLLARRRHKTRKGAL